MLPRRDKMPESYNKQIENETLEEVILYESVAMVNDYSDENGMLSIIARSNKMVG